MSPLRSNWLLAAAGLFVLATAGCKSAPAWMQPGMRPPELAGHTLDGQHVTLSAQRGKAVVVVFFADWCPHCRALLKTEHEIAARLAGRPFALIGVDGDDTIEEMKSMIRRERITWPVLDDGPGTLAKAWGVTGLPTTYVIDADGVIRAYDLTGDDLVKAAEEWTARASK
jgi:cytochrome c biogenesis protein CcmG/thiol:disulfide interchange protein DsbE